MRVKQIISPYVWKKRSGKHTRVREILKKVTATPEEWDALKAVDVVYYSIVMANNARFDKQEKSGFSTLSDQTHTLDSFFEDYFSWVFDSKVPDSFKASIFAAYS